MVDSFQKRKKDVFIKTDKSNIGKWDEKIVGLCDKINSLENYYTTSSCSGRIILMIDAEKKGKDLFVFVSHDKVGFEELKKELDEIVNSPASAPRQLATPLHCKGEDAKSLAHPKEDISNSNKQDLSDKNIKFKFEPCILHIACKTLEDAEKLLEKGKLAGLKKSGIIGLKNGITLELNSTEKLEFPIIRNKKILISEEFLKIVVDEANKKLEKSWDRIERLEKLV